MMERPGEDNPRSVFPGPFCRRTNTGLRGCWGRRSPVGFWGLILPFCTFIPPASLPEWLRPGLAWGMLKNPGSASWWEFFSSSLGSS